MNPLSLLKKQMPLKKSILTASLALLAFSSSANAIIYVTFNQVGGNVEGVLSGSMVAPGVFGGGNLITSTLGGGNTSLYSASAYPFNQNVNGSAFGSGLNTAPDSAEGIGNFGFEGSFLLWDQGIATGQTISPTGKWVWNGKSLEDIGLGALVSQVAYFNSAAGDNIVFIKGTVTVPEPSVALLGSLGLLCLLRRRR